MIIVLGAARVHADKLEAALTLGKEHVARSRAEHGCIAHAVHRDTEEDTRLVFVEKWLDHEALRAHFQVPASQQFVKHMSALCTEKPTMSVYQADELTI